jgi:hypothetical protein
MRFLVPASPARLEDHEAMILWSGHQGKFVANTIFGDSANDRQPPEDTL